jgi:hypothetical protein
MNLLREIASTTIFIAGLLLALNFFRSEFDWILLCGSLGCFTEAYFIWPSKKRGQRDEGHWLLDTLELVIELPVEMVLWLFRLLVRIFKSKDGDFDADF